MFVMGYPNRNNHQYFEFYSGEISCRPMEVDDKYKFVVRCVKD